MANTRKTTATRKAVTPELRQEQIPVKQNTTKKDVILIRNVICKYGTFEAGKTYSVTEEVENKLRKLEAIR